MKLPEGDARTHEYVQYPSGLVSSEQVKIPEGDAATAELLAAFAAMLKNKQDISSSVRTTLLRDGPSRATSACFFAAGWRVCLSVAKF